MRYLAAVVTAILISAACPAAAQQGLDPTAMSLEDLMAASVDHVYGASKFLQKVTDAPAAITIVTADDIRRYGYRTLADVLRSVEGISVSYDRNYSYLGMRGLSRPGDYNTRVLVLVDGHRANDNVEDMATFGTDFQLDVDLIDRVEVIRGPSAAVYGSSAFSAVIAVSTRQGHHVDGFEASASVASGSARRERITFGKRYAGGLELLVSGSAYSAAGAARLFFPEFDLSNTNTGYAEGADGDRSNQLALTASRGGVSVHGVYSARTKQVPTASFNTAFNSGRERTFDGRSWVDVQYTKEIGQSAELLARAYWDRYAYDGDYPYTSDTGDASEPIVMNHDAFRGWWWGGELAVSRRVKQAHRLTVGTEFRRNVEQSTLNYDSAPHVVYIDNQPQTYAVALNLQDEFTINRHMLLNVAGREERIATGAQGFTPKLGLILTPMVNTTVKLLFSRALRAPSTYELYYDSPANAGNRFLEPERTQSLELNAEHYLTPSMKVGGSLFRNTYRDLIVGVTEASGSVVLRNGLDAQARGLGLSWTMKHLGGVQSHASYSWLFDSDAASNAWTSGAPKHLAKVNVDRALPFGVIAGWEVQYESERHTHTGEVLDPALIANLNVVWPNFLRGLELKATAVNLLDGRYSEPVSENHRQGAIAQDGRQLFVGLTWRAK